MKKISIIIPTFNRRDFLEKCLYCVCETADTENNVDIYVWDNASTDDTPDFLASYKQWDFIKPMRSKINIGNEACNKLIPIITTPYVMTLEPDAWIHNYDWDEAIIDCFEYDEILGSLQLQYYNDERNQFGIIWEGEKHDTFTKPRFRCEDVIIPLTNQKRSYALCDIEKWLKYTEDQRQEGRIKVNKYEIFRRPIDSESIHSHFVVCGGLTVWRTGLIKNYQWEGSSGLITDIISEWGKCIERQGYCAGALVGFWAYHAAVAPWFHLGREKEYWAKKAELAPELWNMTAEQVWQWYDQAKEWSGWGSGIPDVEEILSKK